VGLFDSIKKAFSSQEQEDRASLSRKVQSAPNDPQARQKLGIFLMRTGEVVEGLDQLARSAVLYEKDGFASKAIAVLRQMLKHDPRNNDFQKWIIRLLAAEGLSADAHSELRKIGTETGRFTTDDQRLDFFRQMSEYMPKNPMPYLYISDVYRGQKKLMEAVNELGKAVAPTVASGMYTEFTERLRALTTLGEKEHAIRESCGFMWFSIGMPEEGMPILERVVKHEEDMGHGERAAEMREVLDAIQGGWDVSETGAFSFAEVLRKRAEAAAGPASAEKTPAPAKADPEAEPSETRGDEGEYQEEVDIVRDALGRLQAKVHEEIGDTDPDARYNLGIAYKEMGLLAEAVREFRLAMGKPSLLVGASSLLADTLLELGEADAAISALEDVLAAEAPTPEDRRDVRYHKAMLLSRTGREPEAREIFLALYEESPGYRDVKRRTEGYRP
jgi:tetratricopeptide (TPR) repeat protein